MLQKSETQLRKWSTESLSSSEQFSYWCDAVCNEILHLELERHRKGAFHATLLAHQVGSVAINHVRSDGQMADFTQYSINRSPTHYFNFHIQNKSVAKVCQHGQEIILNPGDAILIDAFYPFSIDFPSTFDGYSIKIPRNRLRPLLDNPREATTLTIAGRSQLGKSINHYIQFLRGTIRQPQTEDQIQLLVDNLLGLIAVGTSASVDGQEAGNQSWQTGKIIRIKQFIIANLSDPHLTSTKVAHHFNISRSYVHKLFAKEQQTCGDFICQQRLEHIAQALHNQFYEQHTISEIALQFGFNDLSYFWRLFRKQYGLTPREYRNQG